VNEPFRAVHSRPVATTLLTIGIRARGPVRFILLPVSPLPQVDFPTISVSGEHARRDPGQYGDQRRAPLERISARSPTSPK
jgi:multidrug efflux pump